MPASLIVGLDEGRLGVELDGKAARGADPAGRLALSSASGAEWAIHSGCSDKCALGGTRIYEDDRYAACYAGALVDRDAIPWREILDGLEAGDDGVFRTLQANHAIMAYRKDERAVYLVSDKFGQHSLFMGMLDGRFIASTSMLTFLHVLDSPELDPAWLHDFFFFNYPLESTTLLKGVERLGPGRVVRVDLSTGGREERRYAPQLERQPSSMTMREAQALAFEVFSDRFPHYYDNILPDGCGVGVTGGFDARIVASYMPEGVSAHLYTYGIEGCSDMVNGRKVAGKLGLEHHAFAFGFMGAEELWNLAADTVYYSGGSLNAMRATLAKVYRHLTGAGLGVILTGVSSGHFFRGVFSTPQVLSDAIVKLIRDPAYAPEAFYGELFRDRDALLDSFEAKRRHLLEGLGWAHMPVEERHMSFMHYEQAPKYFGGELVFAESFGHMRSPFWDARIRGLSHEIPLSTLYNSLFLGRRTTPWESKAMLGYILAHGRLRHLNVDGMPPKYWAAGTKTGYYVGKIIHQGPGKLAHRLFPKTGGHVPLEDWGSWVRKAFLPKLRGTMADSPLSRYIDPQKAEAILGGDMNDPMTMHWTGKLLTASLVLDLVERRMPQFTA